MNRLVMVLRMMLLLKSSWLAISFSPLPQQHAKHLSTQLFSGDDADSEIVARRIIVNGDVQGGYYRACVKNEVRVVSTRQMNLLQGQVNSVMCTWYF